MPEQSTKPIVDYNLLRGGFVEAKKLIARPENWTKDCLALDTQGDSVSCLSDHAVCFCSVGAITRSFKLGVAHHHAFLVQHVVLRDFISDKFGPDNELYYSLSIYNDKPSTTHADIMDFFDCAIAYCAAQHAEKEAAQ